MSRKIKLFIDGAWVEGAERETVEVTDPATEKTLAALCMAAPRDLERALASSQAAFQSWRRTAAGERAALIRKAAALMRERVNAMARVLTQEQGKPLGQAHWELHATAAYFDELAGCAERVCGRSMPAEKSGVTRTVTHMPIGPVFAAAPWNLPALLPGRKIATALAAGCSMILKPSKETPETSCLIARCCQDAGMPNGVINVVCGESNLISQTLIRSPVIRKVSFTGSTPIGKSLAALAGECMKKVTMELGGHAPVIICEDADIERVVAMTVPARYANAGQSCIAATRFFVQQKIYQPFVEAFTATTRKLRVGNGLDRDTDVGPLAVVRLIAAMDHFIKDAVECGAELTTGGERLGGPGYFMQPAVLRDVPDRAEIMTAEPFGPVTPITAFAELEEVAERANGTPYGLASYLFTSDLGKARYLTEQLEAGMVGLNTMDVAAPAVPFGGVRDSGTGREGTMEGLLETMVTKTVSMAR